MVRSIVRTSSSGEDRDNGGIAKGLVCFHARPFVAGPDFLTLSEPALRSPPHPVKNTRISDLIHGAPLGKQ